MKARGNDAANNKHLHTFRYLALAIIREHTSPESVDKPDRGVLARHVELRINGFLVGLNASSTEAQWCGRAWAYRSQATNHAGLKVRILVL
jgi:hypothetical protein